MKTIKMYTFAMLMFALGFQVNANSLVNNPSGNDYKWGQHEDVAKEKWALLNNFIGTKDYVSALNPTFWLLQNAPELNVSLYIQAAKVYEENEKLATDPARKVVLQDSALWVYDQRIKLFGGEAEALDKEGKVAWKYLHERKGQDERLFLLYKHIFELNKLEMNVKNATYFMHSALEEFKLQKLTKTELLTIYADLSDFLDKKLANNPADAKLQKN